uniref:Uncharacterized protein n=1 Tax=Kalanchoe fedtschenkoi TaxID=63787 RepID=A0A7N0ZRI8_KALFE
MGYRSEVFGPGVMGRARGKLLRRQGVTRGGVSKRQCAARIVTGWERGQRRSKTRRADWTVYAARGHRGASLPGGAARDPKQTLTKPQSGLWGRSGQPSTPI